MKKNIYLILIIVLPSFCFAQSSFNINITVPPEINSLLNNFLSDPVGNVYGYINTIEGQNKLKNIPVQVKLNNLEDNTEVNIGTKSVPDDIQNILNGLINSNRQKQIIPENVPVKQRPRPITRPEQIQVNPRPVATTTAPKETQPSQPASQPITSPAPASQPLSSANPDEAKVAKITKLLKCAAFADSSGNVLSIRSANYFTVSATSQTSGKIFAFIYPKSFVQEALNDELGFIAPNVNSLSDSMIQKNILGSCYKSDTISVVANATYCCTDASCASKTNVGNVYTSKARIPTENAGDCRDILN